jgi:hypothetical protein
VKPISCEALWVLCGLAGAWLIVSIPLVVLAFQKEHAPRFEFHWGGLGRGLGGWTVSWTAVLAVLVLVLTFGTVAVAIEVVSPPAPPSEAKGDSGEKQSSLPAKPDASGKTTSPAVLPASEK